MTREEAVNMFKQDVTLEAATDLARWITQAPLFIKGFEIGRKPNGDFVRSFSNSYCFIRRTKIFSDLRVLFVHRCR